MDFIFGQFRQFGMVAVVMLFSTGGTVGILKLIKRFAPGIGFPQKPEAKKLGSSHRGKE